jgi:hypothetical protein
MVNKWSEPDDARKNGAAYPNYYVHKSPSGHVIHMDDTKGAESFTLQHRSGSMVQMHPNGDIVIRSHGNKYEVVFGSGKMLITGDLDITVNGGGSLKVEGDYDMTVAGNMHTVVSGDMETIVNGNQNLLVNGNQDTAINGNQTTKVKGNAEHTTEGKGYIGAHDGLALESTGGNMRIAADADMNMRIGGALESESDGGTTIIGETIDLNP